jgi:hypothetical protein
MLEKLLNARSFCGFIDHLVRHWATFFASLGKFGLPSIVKTTACAFLGCWALIVPTLITCFQ